jgi:putative ATP-dependent endonuclease of OLD family
MHLHALALTRFRALGSARVTFDDTTVLIGENDSGKSALLEALGLALDPEAGDAAPRFQAHHFHQAQAQPDAPIAGPIRVQLWFRERQAGEWDGLPDSPLRPLVDPDAQHLREIGLDLRATPTTDGSPAMGQWTLRCGDPAQPRTSRDPAALAYLRRMQPLVWLRAGSLFAAPRPVDSPVPPAATLPPEAARLVARIQASQGALLTGTTPSVQATVDDGFAAARDFLAFAGRHLDPQLHGYREMVAEILGREAPAMAADPGEMGGTMAERIGVLALLAAILRAVPGILPPGAEPIFVIEDPESHLHPTTRAAVLALMARLRWQRIIATQSGEVLASERLSSLRRLTRHDGTLREWRLRPRSLSAEDLRRVGYHLRARHGVATFARCWLLVEGETEYWLLSELARIAGHDFAVEGVACVEFAQCGLRPIIKLARELGIEWHLLADGDGAGRGYAADAARFLRGTSEAERITVLEDRDIEHCFFRHGYAPVFRRWAGAADGAASPTQVIERAIDRHSKPMLALELVLAASARGAAGVPRPLAATIEACIRLARGPTRAAPRRNPRPAGPPSVE